MPATEPASPRATAGRYVALGDSFTEGVGDPDPRLPNGVRGWADRVAEKLAKAEPGWEYANLAVRSKRLAQVIAEQLEPALRLNPTLITLYAGGNDVMDAGTDMRALLDDYEHLVAELTTTGATLLLFTGYDIPLFPAVWLFRKRNRMYNEGVRRIARRHGALLVDYWSFAGYDDRRMWSPDRLHLSKAGHKLLAIKVLDALAITHTITPKIFEPLLRRSPGEWMSAQSLWLRDWVVPLIHRKIRHVTLGDWLNPRWPTLIVVPTKGGLRRFQRDRLSG